MKFQLAKTHRYWWPVRVRIPDPTNAGEYVEQELRVQFEPLPRDEMLDRQDEAAKLSTLRDLTVFETTQLKRIVRNWDGVMAGDDIVPFSPEALDLALQQPWFRDALQRALTASLKGEEARLGN